MPGSRCHSLLVALGLVLGTLFTTNAAAQSRDSHAAQIDMLLSIEDVESTLASLANDFMAHFVLLAPGLPAEDQEILRRATQSAFETDALREHIAGTLSVTTSEADTGPLSASYESGPFAELRALRLGHEPEMSLQEFSSDPATLDAERLRLMVGLVEAKRSSDLALTVDEALRLRAYQLFIDLGGDPGAFPEMSDEQFQTAYRNRTVGLGVEAMYLLEAAPSPLVTAAIEAHSSEGARSFSEQYIMAMLEAIEQAGDDLVSLLVPAEEPAADPLADVEAADPADAPPCIILVCGFLVDWNGPEPIGGTLVYRAPGDFEDHAFRVLVGAGYRLVRGVHDAGLTIQLRPSPQTVRCEVVSGTNPRTCQGVGNVRVELIGSYPGFDGLKSFTVRNRCRANQVMAAEGIASLVASRIHYELTTFEGDERREPRC